jgi:hypothetical protein
MTYLRYANICADLMRSVLKEPFKTKAMQRQAIYFRSAAWTDGKQGTSGAHLKRTAASSNAAHALEAEAAPTAAEAKPLQSHVVFDAHVLLLLCILLYAVITELKEVPTAKP